MWFESCGDAVFAEYSLHLLRYTLNEGKCDKVSVLIGVESVSVLRRINVSVLEMF